MATFTEPNDLHAPLSSPQLRAGRCRATRLRRLTAIALVAVFWGLSDYARATETVDLVPAVPADSLTRVEIVMQVGGEAILMSEGKKTSLPMSVIANVTYDESLLSGSTSAADARALRYYDAANVAIKIAAGGQKPSLRTDRRLIVASRDRAAIRLVSPTGPLVRDELDLLELPGNSLIIDELLPNRTVAIGDTWTHSADLLASLLGLDAASDIEVTSRLEQVADGLAKVVLTGSLRGAVAGVGTEIELKAKYNFDLQSKRINYLAMLIKEKRSVGHVGPGLDVVAKLLVKVTPITDSVHLTREVIAQLPAASNDQALLEYEAPSHTFGFRYDRQWFVTSDEPNVAILRMIQRGELVAQCNISPILAVQKEITLAAYQQDIQRSLDKHFGQFVKAAEETTPEGYRLFRVVAEGDVDGLPIQWIYYLIKTADGQQQASLAFTLEPGLAERFGSTDREFISQLRFMTPPAKEAKASARHRD